MERYPDYTQQRLKLLAERIRRLIYPDVRPVESLLVSEAVDRISPQQAAQLSYRPARRGESFGPLWATFWFRGRATVPSEWDGRRVDLLWESRSEAALRIDGRIVQGLNQDPLKRYNDDRPDAILRQRARGGETIAFEIEMACNRMFGEGYWSPPDPTARTFVLDRCDVALFDPQAWELYYDFQILQQLVAEEPGDMDRAWAGLLLRELNRFANVFDPADRSTWSTSAEILRPLLACRNGSVVHELSAVGHAHIDTAWLWPVAETRRKCERTFSSQIAYMDRYPEYRFACSQAQQYQWIRERDPDLWERIRAKVAAGQFIPVGGTWIEPDCNLPSGESLCRQFLHGQRFFQREFGITCREFWNPDVFGYNGQLPQICRLAGIRRFLTQKLSWNRFNKPDHHTFVWEGIDGSELFTHFPPADTYNAVVTIKQLRDNARSYKDHDRSGESLMLFGFGDGGGGPTPTMLETLRRIKDLQGVPRTTVRSPGEFFDRLERDNTDRARVVGELYFEYHRGTYTTQAAVKAGNRRAEGMLHDIEFLATAAGANGAHPYPAGELDRLWKITLLNQFHDILPGSSIREVYEDAARDHAEVLRAGSALRDATLRNLVGPPGDRFAPVNTVGFSRDEIVESPDGRLVRVLAPPCGIGRIVPIEDQVSLHQTGDRITLENARLRAVFDRGGDLLSLIEKSTGREALSGPGNRLLLYVDEPNAWDAWDVDPQHMETERACPPAESCRILTDHLQTRGEIVFERTIGTGSTMRQTVRLDSNARRLEFHCECDWREDHRMLKVAFPVTVRAMNATYEMQFGCVERPTHFNTRYDLARYEVPGHRWSDLSEPGFGVALLSESKYGFSTFGGTMRMSLLRSSRHPDTQADRGVHRFACAILPHAGDWRAGGVVAEGFRFNQPILFAPTGIDSTERSFAAVNDPNLVLDTVKRAEDGDAIVLRLYECHGARGTAEIRTALPFQRVVASDILETDGEPIEASDGVIHVPYRPFQIITLKLRS